MSITTRYSGNRILQKMVPFGILTVVLSLFFLTSGIAQTKLTKRDQDEIRFQARKKIEKNLPELLNTLSMNDLTEFERLTLIQDSYLPGPGQVFFNDNIIVENDIDPSHTGSDNIVDTPIEKYLKNFDLFYAKSDNQTIKVSNIVVSPVSDKEPFFVRVFFTITYLSKHNKIDKPYQPFNREAELRAEKLDKKWEIFVTRIGFQPVAKNEVSKLAGTEKKDIVEKAIIPPSTIVPAQDKLTKDTLVVANNNNNNNNNNNKTRPNQLPHAPSANEHHKRRAILLKSAGITSVVGAGIMFLVINSTYGKYKTQLQTENNNYQTWYMDTYNGERAPSSTLIRPESILSFGKPGIYFSGAGILAGAAFWLIGSKNARLSREAKKKTVVHITPETNAVQRYAGVQLLLNF